MTTTHLPKENFTAILPVTCNADCGFCPEKEMEKKAPKGTWISNLIGAINKTYHEGYDHISLSGGEPTLDPRLLSETISAILNHTKIEHIGLTTNGQFLESMQKLGTFINAASTRNGRFIPYFINISRHAFDTDENNAIMGVNYKHTIRDILHFRTMIPSTVSFRLNMVLTNKTDTKRLFEQAKLLSPIFNQFGIDIAFRTDYSLIINKDDGLVPQNLRDDFESVFGKTEVRYSCPTCVTYTSNGYPRIFLKGADFEPTEMEEIKREFVFHQDGILYNDWKRNKPVKFESEEVLNKLLGHSLLMAGIDADNNLASFSTQKGFPDRSNMIFRSGGRGAKSTGSCGSGGCGSSGTPSCGSSPRSSGCGGSSC